MRHDLTDNASGPSKLKAPRNIALGYFLVGAAWILFSDRLLATATSSVEAFSRWQTIKGWGYVIVTAILLYGVLRFYVGRWQGTEDALRESEARFRRAVMDAPYPTILHAEDGEVITINNIWTQITGYTSESIPTITAWTEKAYGAGKELVRADIDRLYDLDERVDEGEYTITTRNGEQRTWQFSSAPLGHLPDGRRLVMSMASDITKRKRVEEALHEHRDHLEEEVERRTAELRTLVNAMAGREIRMAELKKTIRQLREQLKKAGLEPIANDPLFEEEQQ
jgi:PAS domain S-box-containing protein